MNKVKAITRRVTEITGQVIEMRNLIPEVKELARENGYNDAILHVLEKIDLTPEQHLEILKLYKR